MSTTVTSINCNTKKQHCLPFGSDKNEATSSSIFELKNKVENINKNNGFIGSSLNRVKSAINLGASSKKCDKAIRDYELGKITFEEANKIIDSYNTKQKNGTEVITSLITGFATVAIAASAIATGGLSLGVIAAAGAGAVLKSGLKLADRATNDIKNDEFDLKQIGKDAASGVLDGVVSTLTMGMGTSAVTMKTVAEQTLKQTVKNGIKQGIKAGAASGAMMGAGGYAIDAAFEKDVDFNTKDLLTSTIGGAVGGAVLGGITTGIGTKIQYNKLSYKYKYRKNHFNELSKEEIAEISEQAEKLSRSYTKNQEVKKQLEAVFDKEKLSTIQEASARVKSEKSIFAKLANKYLKKKINPANYEECFNAIGDAYGTRIQLKGLDAEEVNTIIQKRLQNTSFNKKQLVEAIRGNYTGLDEKSANSLKFIANDLLDELKEKQTNEVVQALIKGIKEGKIKITEINNYGDDLSSYFTRKQLAMIADAHFEKTGQKLVIVTKEQNVSPLKIYSNPTSEIVEETTNAIYKTSGAIKDSGYATCQMNVEYTFKDGSKGLGELQIRGSELNIWGDAEHVPYDIRSGKITEMDIKYKEIFDALKSMRDDCYATYQKYSTDIYNWYRLKEFGIDIPEPKINIDLFDKKGRVIPRKIVEKFTKDGLIALHKN